MCDFNIGPEYTFKVIKQVIKYLKMRQNCHETWTVVFNYCCFFFIRFSTLYFIPHVLTICVHFENRPNQARSYHSIIQAVSNKQMWPYKNAMQQQIPNKFADTSPFSDRKRRRHMQIILLDHIKHALAFLGNFYT